MARRNKKTLSVALFPFLAVLVCTMGSLIFLLLVTTRQIRERAIALAMAEAPPDAPALPVMSISTPAPVAPKLIVIQAEPVAIPQPLEPKFDPREQERQEHAAALAQRERELNELLAQWRQRASQLAAQREEQTKALAQRRALQQTASRKIASLESELREQEVKLGSLNGALSAPPINDAAEKERRLIEQQFADLQRRLRTAQATDANGDSKFMVVPFDPQSGTSRRPILIECTAEGLRFIPEDVMIRPDDLEGFTPRVNPLLAGSNSLVAYWTAWNLKQPHPARQPEPYVLLLVRPSGTVAYYVAMKMLVALKQPHGYELIEEDTLLQQPPVDPGAKAVCEAAVRRLLAEREQIMTFAAGGSGRGGFARGGGAHGDAFRTGASGAGSRSGTPNRFEVNDVVDEENEVGSRSWERVENFAGRNPRPSSTTGQPLVAGGTSGPAPSQRIMKGNENESGTNSPPAGTNLRRPDENGGHVGRRNEVVSHGEQGSAEEAFGAGHGSPQRTIPGVERLTNEDDTGSAPGAAGRQAGGAAPLDTGLGSTGTTMVPVYDRRGKKATNSKSLDPEMFERKRWGLSAPDAAIGLEREVRIDVEANRLVVGGKHAIRMGEGETKQEAFERLVAVLDLQARDWGQPPQGFFWKPSLKFVVAEGGNSNFETARSLAERASLTASTEYASGNSEKPTRTPATPISTKPSRVIRGGTP